MALVVLLWYKFFSVVCILSVLKLVCFKRKDYILLIVIDFGVREQRSTLRVYVIV